MERINLTYERINNYLNYTSPRGQSERLEGCKVGASPNIPSFHHSNSILSLFSRFIIFLLFLSLSGTGNLLADSLNVYTCFKSAELLSPLKKQEALIQTDRELNLKNISTGYLPEFSIAGKATYQSDVFTIPVSSPAFDFPEIPKDQYQVTLNVRQNIFDAGTTRSRHNIEEAKNSLAMDQLNSDLYNIKDIVNQLYFSALILQENIKTLNKSKQTLLSQQKTIQSRVDNGAVLPAALYSIEKELMNLDEQIIQLTYNRKTSLELLSKWIGRDLSDSIQLAIPQPVNTDMPAINRPELKLFASQQQVLESTMTLSNSKQLPFLYAFAQGGYGSPNPFDFFNTKFTDFYMVGLQLSWKPFNWGNTKREKQSLRIQQEEISARKEDFERNISMSLQKERNEYLKLQELIKRDDNIVSLQKKIADQYFSQMENGVITPSDYFTEFNALTHAEINRQIHHILLSQASMNMLIKSGNIE